MTDFEIVRARVVLTDISSRAYEHPADRGALTALRTVPGWDGVLRALSGVLRERSLRLLYLASSVRVSDRQYAHVHDMLVEGCRVLDIPVVPELYVVRNPGANAMTLGMDAPFLVLTSGLLDLLDAEELRFVIGHELGHVLSGHAVYRTMLLQLLAISARMAWLPIGGLAIRGVILALEEWQRKSELSADRAGLLACQDPGAALGTQVKLAGGGDLDQMDPRELLAQAKEYEAAGDIRDGALKILNLVGAGSHPFAVMRAGALRQWIDDGEYDAILAGRYPRRSDDAATSPTAEVRNALRSYARSFGESTDPLMTFLREASAGAGTAASSAAAAASDAATSAASWVRGVFRPGSSATATAGPAGGGAPSTSSSDGGDAAHTWSAVTDHPADEQAPPDDTDGGPIEEPFGDRP